MTDEQLIERLRSNIFGTGTTMLAADRIEALVKERDALKVSYEDIYADAMADAESDARDFETDLWKLVRQYITELGFDWSGDASLDGVTADEALQHIRECMDGETARAERLKGQVKVAFDEGFLAGTQDGWMNNPRMEREWENSRARAALAEIKGESHD